MSNLHQGTLEVSHCCVFARTTGLDVIKKETQGEQPSFLFTIRTVHSAGFPAISYGSQPEDKDSLVCWNI